MLLICDPLVIVWLYLLVYVISVFMVYAWCLFFEVFLVFTESIEQIVDQIVEAMVFEFLLNLADVVNFL